MRRITIRGTTEYDVLIEYGLLAEAGTLIRETLGGEKALIVSDTKVADIYLDIVKSSLAASGYEVSCALVKPGDGSKTIENYSKLINNLAENSYGSADILVALGGGMIGDLAGFTAATYKRGMQLVQLPTSLLAAVDSSVGGKNALNTNKAKNQIGTIRNPSLVICDPSVLETLDERAMKDGYAEVIKYGVLNGPEITDALRAARESGDYTEVISRAVEIKRDIVEMDEGDVYFRQYLNLGHLVGHAIEASRNYAIGHGAAVARGLAIETRCCALAGYTEISTYIEITALLEEFGFDNSDTYRLEDLMPFMVNDKRIRDGSIQIIVPKHMGECDMHRLDADKLESFIKLGL